MGLFGSSKKTSVGTSVVRVIEDKGIPESHKLGVSETVIAGGDMVDNILNRLIESIGIRAERMYDYGKDRYTYGLPTNNMYVSTQGKEEVRAILERITGSSVGLAYTEMGPPNRLHMAWMHLISAYGYDTETNELRNLKSADGKDTYLYNMEIVIPGSEINEWGKLGFNAWGRPPDTGDIPDIRGIPKSVASIMNNDPYRKIDHVTEESIRITYGWVKRTIFPGTILEVVDLHTDILTIPTSVMAFDEEASYFHVKYELDNKEHYWLYKVGSGTYPTLDELFDAGPTEIGNYFPFAYFRYNKSSMANMEGQAGYTTSKKLLKYINMDYADIIESVHENPDIGDVEQAMMIMALPANTDVQIEQQYLYEYFDELLAATDMPINDEVLHNAGTFIALNKRLFSVEIRDKRFKMALSYDGIYKKFYAGNIADRNAYSSTTEIQREVIKLTDLDGVVTERNIGFPVHKYMKQVSDVMYEEITVYNLRMYYHIYGNHVVTADRNEDILLIPIDRTITERFGVVKKEKLYSRSLHFVFNSRVVTKVKWYQSTFFQVIMLVVAVVMTIVSLGTALTGLGAIYAAFGFKTAILFVINALYVPVLISLGVKLFSRVVGGKIALVVAAVIAMYVGVRGLTLGSLKGVPWASELITAANGLIEGVKESIQKQLQGLQAEYEAFISESEKALELLEKTSDLLKSNPILSPLMIIGESPEAYYNRTMYSGNVGILGIDAIANYVPTMTALPTIAETIGGFDNEWNE